MAGAQLLKLDRQNALFSGEKFDWKESGFPSVFSSTCIWLLLLLVLFDLGLRFSQPLQYVADPRFRPVRYDPWVAKFPRFFDANVNPTVALIGSSLPMAAFGKYDRLSGKAGLKSDSDVELRTYLDSTYFASLLNSHYGRRDQVSNLTCAGCMASDAYVITQALLDKKRTPEIIIYGIAPRDFQDNCMPKIGQSPIFEVIPGWVTWGDLFQFRGSPAEGLQRFFSCLFDFYRSRRKYRDVCVGLFSDWINHPQTLFACATLRAQPQAAASVCNMPPVSQAAASLGNESDKPASKAEDLKMYERRYQPFNGERFGQEREYFERLLKACAQRHVRLILVRMPLTAENAALMPAELSRRFDETLAAAVKSGAASVIDMNSGIFAADDFVDSAHLNEMGSKKFQDNLVGKLSQLVSK